MKKSRKKGSPPAAHSSGPDLAEVSRILEFMEQHSLEDFEYENGNFHIRLRKSAAHVSSAFRAVLPTPEIVVPHAAPAPASEPSPAPAGAASPVSAEVPENLHVIKSPIVGTFYSAPSPGAEPFTSVGDHVESGQVLCIIEAMKLMNEIESDVAGEVMRIFVENGQPVEYGEPLFAIHPQRKQ